MDLSHRDFVRISAGSTLDGLVRFGAKLDATTPRAQEGFGEPSTAWQKFLAGSAGRHSCSGRNPSSGNPLDSRLRGNDRSGASSRITDEGLPP